MISLVIIACFCPFTKCVCSCRGLMLAHVGQEALGGVRFTREHLTTKYHSHAFNSSHAHHPVIYVAIR